ncbi:MAG: TlpA family protein disulfide reductase [Thermomicrobiales bacterium]
MCVLLAALGAAVSIQSGAALQGASPTAVAALPSCAVSATTSGSPSAGANDARPAWQTMAMTDVRTGRQFAIGDFRGCTVYVETMANWCGACRHQLGNVAEAEKSLDRDRFVFIAISVETDLSPADLASYAKDAGFDWVFSVGSPAMLKALVDEFGRGAIVPPSTPHVIVAPDGSFGDLHTGYSQPDELVRLMTAASGAAGG